MCRPEVNQITLGDPTVTGGTSFLAMGPINRSALVGTRLSVRLSKPNWKRTSRRSTMWNVTGSGTEDDPWVIEFVTPCEFAGGSIANFAS